MEDASIEQFLIKSPAKLAGLSFWPMTKYLCAEMCHIRGGIWHGFQ